MVANVDEVRQLADACVVVSTKTRDPKAAAELLRISYRILQLADPALSPDTAAFNRQQLFGTADGLLASEPAPGGPRRIKLYERAMLVSDSPALRRSSTKSANHRRTLPRPT